MYNNYKKMKHIILDLDETIVHISSKPSSQDQFQFQIGSHTYYGMKRTGLDDFLRQIFAYNLSLYKNLENQLLR